MHSAQTHITSHVRNHQDICSSAATRAAKNLLAFKPRQPPSLLILPNNIRWLRRPFDTNRSAFPRDMEGALSLSWLHLLPEPKLMKLKFTMNCLGLEDKTHSCSIRIFLLSVSRQINDSTYFMRFLCFISSLCFSYTTSHMGYWI